MRSKEKLIISPAEAHFLRDNIKNLGLQTPDWFERLSCEELASGYNWMCDGRNRKSPLRVLIRYLGFAKEAALIVAAEYEFSYRFKPVDYYVLENFQAANRRFGENANALTKARSHWYSPARYYYFFAVWYTENIMNEMGYDAWIT